MEQSESNHAKTLRQATHRTIQKVTNDLENHFQFNTAIASLMEFYNTTSDAVAKWNVQRATSNASDVARHTSHVIDEDRALTEALDTLIVLLSPFAPHIAEELWERLGHPSQADTGLAKHPWPSYDEAMLKTEQINIAIQVNGKLRGILTVPAESSEDRIKEQAFADKKIGAWLQGKQIAKVIYIQGRLLNIVVKE
jgi:leucyl-tRNA synthetase